MRGLPLLMAAVAVGGCRDSVEPSQGAPSVLTLSAHYDIVELGTLGGSSSEVAGINDQSQMAGASETAAGATHAFLWRDGVMEDLGTLGGDFSRAVAINARGDVAGLSTDSTGVMRAAVWVAGGSP